MAKIKPFFGLRPEVQLVEKVAELPYDVVSSQEAKDIAKGNKYSFFHISKPEIDLDPDINPYDESVYEKGRSTLLNFIESGILTRDTKESLYLYTQIMGGRSQTGLVTCCSIDDYLANSIKKHELTREDKENDRTRHLEILGANTGPVFLMFKDDGSKTGLFEKAMSISPVYDFTSSDGIRHILRIIDDTKMIESFIAAFRRDDLYIADGHHRAASAIRVGVKKRQLHPDYKGNEEFNWFLSVIFPHSQLKIMPYNRVIKDLNGLSDNEFLNELSKEFSIDNNGVKVPIEVNSFSLYLNRSWYTIRPKFQLSTDPIESLDVSILQRHVLSRILGIQDPRKDKRIDFIGGIRGTDELEKLVTSREYALAFSMFPTTLEQLINVSDNNAIMPPKSTWFEPKLRSGLILHLL